MRFVGSRLGALRREHGGSPLRPRLLFEILSFIVVGPAASEEA
jgi:hypothetical protein